MEIEKDPLYTFEQKVFPVDVTVEEKLISVRMLAMSDKAKSAKVGETMLEGLSEQAHTQVLLRLCLEAAWVQDWEQCRLYADGIRSRPEKLLAFLLFPEGKIAPAELQRLAGKAKRPADAFLRKLHQGCAGDDPDGFIFTPITDAVASLQEFLAAKEVQPKEVQGMANRAQGVADLDSGSAALVMEFLVLRALVQKNNVQRAREFTVQFPTASWQARALLWLYTERNDMEDLYYARAVAEAASTPEQRVMALGEVAAATKLPTDCAKLTAVLEQVPQGSPLRNLAQGYLGWSSE